MDARQELEDEANAAYGDPRRCPIHGIVTSSPDGMFDAPCGACESEMSEAANDDDDATEYDPDDSYTDGEAIEHDDQFANDMENVDYLGAYNPLEDTDWSY